MQIADLVNIIPAEFSDNAKVWIYQSNRPFSEREETEINEQLYQFCAQWQSHGDPVKGWAKLLFRQFIVMMADETEVMVGGCSTDSSVRVVKSIERQYNVNLFDRMTLTFLVKDKAEMLPFNQLQYAVDKGYINKDTLFFNNVAGTKKELLNNWLIPMGKSWLVSRIHLIEKA
ncbi:MAG: hypothetical protein K0R82_967 [Flavipsychrobacter sp.]|jgi:hypothetical protein|nr:hypothetical protein [Flavipsychrobacter sp.]